MKVRRGTRVLSAAVALVVVLGTWGSAAGSLPADARVTPSPVESTSTPRTTETFGATAAPEASETPTAVPSPDQPSPDQPSPQQSATETAPSGEPTADEPEPVTSDAPPAPEPAPSSEPTENPTDDVQGDEPLSEFARAPPGEPGEADVFETFADIGIAAAGIPEGPRSIWSESFEQGLTNTASGLPTYATNRYTASSGWISGTSCTGVLVNYLAAYPNPQFCPTQPNGAGQSSLAARETRRMADVLGQVQAGRVGGATSTTPTNNSDATTRSNHALVALPYNAVAGGTTVLQSAAAIGVTAPDSRYYALKMDAAGARCGTNNASLQLNLVTGTATPATLLAGFAAPVVPCAATGNVYYASNPTLTTLGTIGGVVDPVLTQSARAATFNGTNTALLTPAQISSARVQVVNTVTGAGSGFGIDDIRVLDVTPALDVTFDEVATATVPTTLTFTITNTSDLFAKTDWSFSSALPQGLVVAPNRVIAGTCANVTGTAFAVTAAAGSGSISAVGGDLAAAATSCTITVDVVATTAGTYSSGTVTPTGLIASAPASLTVNPATTITIRKNLPARTAPADQFTLSLRQGPDVLASTTTSGTATGIQASQISRAIVQPGSTYTISEAPTTGAGIGYSNSYECTRTGTVIASGSGGSGTLTIPDELGAEVICTFTNTAQTQRLFCDTNRFYSITAAGALQQGDIVTGGLAPVGGWQNVTTANGLGIGSGGESAYALERSTNPNNAQDASDVLSILKWTPGGGFVKLPNTAYTTRVNGAEIVGSIVAGAVDLTNGRYYFGIFADDRFYIFSFTETNPTGSQFASVGSFSTGAAPNGNGDMAFDARGNLYVVGAATVNTASNATIYTVPAESLAAPSSGALTVRTSNISVVNGTDTAGGAFTNINGIAFSPRGTVYLANASSAYEFDVTTWQRVSGTPRVAVSSTDLGGCSSPSTITVQKNVVGRQNAADQFALSASVQSLPVFATATTTGATTGRQTAQIGPYPTPIGSTVTISETMAAGSVSPLTTYRTLYECYSDGVRLSSGTTATGSVTMPNRLSAAVNCTYFNSPSPVSNVRITKTIQEFSRPNSPGVGWTVGTTATATTGIATALPSEAPRQQTDAAGQASWQVLFGSAASRATVTVSEVQQAGFAFVSGSCTVNGTAVTTTFTPTNAPAGQTISASLTGVAPGAAIECSIVNRPTASLTLVKQVSFGSAAPTDWTLNAVGPAASTGALPGPSGRSGTAAVTGAAVTPGAVYRLSEAGGPLTYVQTGSWQCRTATGTTVTVTAAGDVTPTAGAAVTCTVTNATASVTLLKQVITPQAGFQAPDWTVTATPAVLAGGTLPTESRRGAEYVASGNPANTFDVRPGHSYTLSEAVTDPTQPLAYQELRLEQLTGSTWTPVSSRTISAPAAGQTAVYRFVNAPVEPTRLPLTGGTSADAYYIGGGVLLVLALTLLVWNRRQRMRGAFR